MDRRACPSHSLPGPRTPGPRMPGPRMPSHALPGPRMPNLCTPAFLSVAACLSPCRSGCRSPLPLMVPLPHGPTPSWSHSLMVPLPHGPTPSWSHSLMVPLSHGPTHGPTPSWSQGHSTVHALQAHMQLLEAELRSQSKEASSLPQVEVLIVGEVPRQVGSDGRQT